MDFNSDDIPDSRTISNEEALQEIAEQVAPGSLEAIRTKVRHRTIDEAIAEMERLRDGRHEGAPDEGWKHTLNLVIENLRDLRNTHST